MLTAFASAALTRQVSYFASAAAAGLESDLTKGPRPHPRGDRGRGERDRSAGVLALPIAAAFDLMIRRRGRCSPRPWADIESSPSCAFTAVIARLITRYPNPRLLLTLTGRENPGQLPPLNAILAGRRVRHHRASDRTSTVWPHLHRGGRCDRPGEHRDGGVTATALALSILLGWAIGLAMRYVWAMPTTRPSGLAVTTALEVGYPVTVLRAHREFSAGRRWPPPPAPGRRWTCWCSTAISRAPGWLPASGGPYGCATTVHRRG